MAVGGSEVEWQWGSEGEWQWGGVRVSGSEGGRVMFIHIFIYLVYNLYLDGILYNWCDNWCDTFVVQCVIGNRHVPSP